VEQRTLTAADVDERSNSEKSNAATVAGRADDDIAVIFELKLQHKFSVHRPSNTWRNIQRMQRFIELSAVWHSGSSVCPSKDGRAVGYV